MLWCHAGSWPIRLQSSFEFWGSLWVWGTASSSVEWVNDSSFYIRLQSAFISFHSAATTWALPQQISLSVQSYIVFLVFMWLNSPSHVSMCASLLLWDAWNTVATYCKILPGPLLCCAADRHGEPGPGALQPATCCCSDTRPAGRSHPQLRHLQHEQDPVSGELRKDHKLRAGLGFNTSSLL